MRLRLIFFFLALSVQSCAQQKFVVKMIGSDDKTPIPATISIKEIHKSFVGDSTGIMTITIKDTGSYTLIASAIGYSEIRAKIRIPHYGDTLEIELKTKEHEMDEVIIQSTRTSRTIQNVPTRVETIALEEIDEKNNMRPSNVAMLLHESTGIQVQQTSATSGSASIRIQGLDGRYTQLLKDGFANFGNFSSGLSILEIPPLDLSQVEIIKGPASPLFGGGAIAGVINFISKDPKDKPEYSFIVNHSNISQTNIGGFGSQRRKKTGYTFLILYNRQKAFDVDKDEFTEIPKSTEVTINPKLFYYPDVNTTISIGNSLTTGERTGGDIILIKGNADTSHQYFEKNKTLRNILTLELEKKIKANEKFIARQSFSLFDRTIQSPGYNFAGIDYNAYTDVSYVTDVRKHALVIGGNFIYNDFGEKVYGTVKRNNRSSTGGIYAQHTLDATDKVKLETGLRFDLASYKNSIYSNTEFFFLPRISLYVKYNHEWSSRVSGGIGYKLPTLFTEESETILYKNVAQLNNVRSEKSYGGTADVNFKTNIGNDLALTFNHMFFCTIINKPLVLQGDTNNYRFINVSKPILSAGFETNTRLIYKNKFKLFLGYTFTHIKAKYLSGNQYLPLVPKHKLNIAVIYEDEEVFKLGLEGYVTGRQYLSDGTDTPLFAELGLMAEKIFRKFSLFINFENITDTRQSRYEHVVSGSHINPIFNEIWTHTEGFVFNGGIKLYL